jgi:hypothetical protein
MPTSRRRGAFSAARLILYRCATAIPARKLTMKSSRFLSSGLVGIAAFCAALLVAGEARAQDTSSVNSAFQIARSSVSPGLQTKVVSVYGIGTPAVIEKWYIIFYDPSVPSHGRAVQVENGKILKSYDAQGGVTYSSKLTFDPSRITSEQPALNAAQNYAAKHNIAYDGVRALLKQTSLSKPFRWRIELMDAGHNRGFVMVNAVDDSVATYVAPAPPHETGSGTGSAATDAQDFGNDVKNTFLGIGGDLQQFFTGERTVDR